ncbi:MAG: hypothetical protein CM15mV66_610 [uncultured marine virus]|nr:MAG: hypothetical protein CM15mV66_610 [uncultured marine virus]
MYGMKKTNGSKKLKGKQNKLPAALKKRSWLVKRKSKELIIRYVKSNERSLE